MLTFRRTRTISRVASFLLMSVLLAGCNSSAPARVSPTSTTPSAPLQPASVTLVTGTHADRIPANFVGFSIEPQYLCRFLDTEQQDPTLDQFYRALGPSIIRFGGNSMDSSTWSPDASCSQLTFGISTIVDVFSFAQRVDAQIIWGLNLKANDPNSAADEAAAVAAIGGDRLLGFEFGNEPNTWTTQAAYTRMWNQYAAAVTAAIPDAPLTGPGMFDNEGHNWFGQFVSSNHASLSRVTYHFYPLQSTASGRSATTPTIANLLSAQLMARTAADVARVERQASAYGLPLEIEETNSVNGGGAMGVSNVFASALWSADYLFTMADQGVAAVNFHSNGGILSADPYAPIAVDSGSNSFYARPLYYGMLLFHIAAGDGATPLKTTVSSPANIAAHALMSDNGSLEIVLINKDRTNDARVHVALGAYSQAFQEGRAIRLTASSLDSTTGITLAGAGVGADGTWSSRTSEHVGVKNASFTIMAPHGSMVLITLTA